MSRVTSTLSASNRLNAALSLSAGVDAYTVVFWIKPTESTNAAKTLYNFETTAGNYAGGLALINAAPQNLFHNTFPAVTGGTVSQDAWTFCAFRFTTTTATVQVGLSRTSDSQARTGLPSTTLSLNAMGRPDLDPFQGKMAHLAVWTRALTDTELDNLAGGDNPLTITGDRLAYYPMTDASLANEFTPDNSHTAGSLTVVGTVTSDTGDNPTVDAPPSAAPTISSVTPSTITAGSNPVITGTNFEASQGTGTVKLSPTDNVADAAVEVQGITTWNAGDPGITLSGVTFPAGTTHGQTLYLFVTNNSGDTNASGYPVTASLAPTASAPEVFDATIDGFSFRFDTDTGNGLVIWAAYPTAVLRDAATVSSIQAEITSLTDALAAGQFNVVAAGTQTVAGITGLGENLTRYVRVFHYGDVTVV